MATLQDSHIMPTSIKSVTTPSVVTKRGIRKASKACATQRKRCSRPRDCAHCRRCWPRSLRSESESVVLVKIAVLPAWRGMGGSDWSRQTGGRGLLMWILSSAAEPATLVSGTVEIARSAAGRLCVDEHP